MPAIKPLTEFNRNQNALIAEIARSQEPLYLTRNGSACVVVMDAHAFDEAMRFRNDLLEQEMRTYQSILQGAEQIANGESLDAGEADAMIRAAKGW
ncbi:type II toxin-antitoxin system Phd/YefM family antitoxin [Xiamenia xianingshaonis]|uniref:Antitoxin n=1 Tax=Xiamenia xianingshaonis TaxID=2682776 RepID=A0A9E6MPG4_9ACTN|nr:type II toxin-antitoxin system Phd/YefM family antitoxin [Xiamenia xianingshaonis]NHM14967.1 type II toxin-antitoxin system Phd/YefM family antitoxin [Xiamenia xianingshaonis]NHM16859.1 type II toxin-antitoxin system Phd/YefM family antitoxin [Xiamenia xianingshaonis]QTU84014.1 type II toxin-antitoxin system Phd/YefM family antitoxin [Xiamenia xianingshaonis]